MEMINAYKILSRKPERKIWKDTVCSVASWSVSCKQYVE
jgi:hypothetical protein